MKIYTDFHIHTALSPCGDEDMTPNNIVNMAAIKGLQAIAITDHNSCANVAPCMEIGKQLGIVVIPGMELQTREEIHVLCLFRTLEDAMVFQEFVQERLPKMENKEEIFGQQVLFDAEDQILGYEKRMLLASVDLSFDDAFYKVKELNGVFIPAHVDKDTFGLFANLGFIPPYLDIKILEYHSKEKIELFVKKGFVKNTYRLIHSSDAHYLQDILEVENEMEVNEYSTEGIVDALTEFIDK